MNIVNRIFTWFESRIDPYPENNPQQLQHGLFGFVWSSLSGMKGWILLLAFLTMGTGIIEALLFQFMGVVIDWLGKYTPHQLWQQKGYLLLAMAGVLIVSVFWSFFSTTTRLEALQGNFPMRLRWDFHRRMLGQSLSFYQDEFAGRVSAKVMQTALAVRDSVLTLANIMVYISVYFVTSGVILVSLDTYLILPFLVWLGLFVTILYFIIPRLSKTAQEQANARALMTGRITDAYANITTVKLFSHASREADYAKRSMEEFMITVRKQMRLATYLDTLTYANNVLLILSTSILSIWLWSASLIAVGAIATAIAMTLRVNSLSHWIMWESARLFENIGIVNDGMRTLSKPHTILDKPNAHPLNVGKGDIHFEHVDFAYGDEPLLKDFNLHIKPGEKVGLIGRSGAGKSTIVNLLLRFYEPQSGEISIDNQNIADVTQESLRADIGLVTQDTSLLHRSVRDNIIYGRPDATEEEILQAAERAKAADFIPHLTDPNGRSGLDAHVGERGIKLSGGQRQRIAIARVMLKDAPILILDEATSALDSEVETAIQESLDKMMENKTVIAIAHRLSTIAAMDRLIVLDKGHIIEQGTHQELLAKNGLYAKLWQHQSGGFLNQDNA
ncbi:ABC transporter-like protein [Actinobacillus delphinicola]|uniref:ABC transporter-like protein n=1 Tax=Actinobacillus delphinicola TaxID=51161 RepID=A0A448TSQ0_9PAST|nr:ABC transporter-like protein [Actinobacillus delphinicola]